MRTVPVKLSEEVYQWIAGRGKVSAVVREAVEFYMAVQDGEPGRTVSDVEKVRDVGMEVPKVMPIRVGTAKELPKGYEESPRVNVRCSRHKVINCGRCGG